jgi:predicted acylesterase/phospholipase RssA
MTSVNIQLDKKISEILNKYKGNENSKKTNLVLSGGGIKGIGHLGALKVLYENKLLTYITTIVGSSIGGIIGALYCAGYKGDELFVIIESLNLSNLINLNPSNIFNSYGLDDGSKLMHIIDKLLSEKNISSKITFKEFFELTKIKLIITASCLNDKQVYYISYLSHPNMSLLIGLRMTSSIPLIFMPVIYENKFFVDGACMDNYPIKLFENDINSTIGIYLRTKIVSKTKINNMEDYLFDLFECISESVTCELLRGYENNTIVIDLEDISLTNSNITKEIKKNMYITGCIATKKFLNK